VSTGGTWRHGAAVYRRRTRRAQQFAHTEVLSLDALVASMDVRTGKDDADLFPEDGSVV
jgi:hypothetical protein